MRSPQRDQQEDIKGFAPRIEQQADHEQESFPGMRPEIQQIQEQHDRQPAKQEKQGMKFHRDHLNAARTVCISSLLPLTTHTA